MVVCQWLMAAVDTISSTTVATKQLATTCPTIRVVVAVVTTVARLITTAVTPTTSEVVVVETTTATATATITIIKVATTTKTTTKAIRTITTAATPAVTKDTTITTSTQTATTIAIKATLIPNSNSSRTTKEAITTAAIREAPPHLLCLCPCPTRVRLTARPSQLRLPSHNSRSLWEVTMHPMLIHLQASRLLRATSSQARSDCEIFTKLRESRSSERFLAQSSC